MEVRAAATAAARAAVLEAEVERERWEVVSGDWARLRNCE